MTKVLTPNQAKWLDNIITQCKGKESFDKGDIYKKDKITISSLKKRRLVKVKPLGKSDFVLISITKKGREAFRRETGL